MKRILDIQTPISFDIDEFADRLKRLDDFDAVIIEECGGLSATAIANKIIEDTGKEVFLKIACRDRNRIALRSQLLTAASTGLMNLVLIDGTHPIHTPFPDAKPVYDLDALGLLRMIRGEPPGFGDGAGPLLSSLSWQIGVTVGGNTSADIARVKSFLATGIDLLFVSSVKSVSLLRNLTDKPIVLSVIEEEGRNLLELIHVAESAGADGVSVIVQACSMESV